MKRCLIPVMCTRWLNFFQFLTTFHLWTFWEVLQLFQSSALWFRKVASLCVSTIWNFNCGRKERVWCDNGEQRSPSCAGALLVIPPAFLLGHRGAEGSGALVFGSAAIVYNCKFHPVSCSTPRPRQIPAYSITPTSFSCLSHCEELLCTV